MLKEKKVVVTGGAGFVGSHLCDALIKKGNKVICVDNLVGSGGSDKNIEHLLENPDFLFVEESITAWAENADLSGVDTIFHQACSKNTVCMKDPVLDLEVNGLGTLKLLMAANKYNVRKFVHASTGSVFGELEEKQDELHPKNPVSLYGVSKLTAESYCRVFGEIFGLDYTVFRYYHVIGPRQDDSDTGGVVPIFVRNCVNKEDIKIYGTGEQVRSFTSVFDVVNANIKASELGIKSKGYFNCASSIQVSIKELAEYVNHRFNNVSEIKFYDWRPGDIIRFDIDNTKIVNTFGISFNKDWKSIVNSVIDFKNED